MKLAPIDIEVILHYYVSPDPHPRITTLAISQAIDFFIEQSMLVKTGEPEVIRVTNRGKVWIDMLRSTPFPEQRWIDPRKGAMENEEI